jgi:ketosteroid isomerase-like protein
VADTPNPGLVGAKKDLCNSVAFVLVIRSRSHYKKNLAPMNRREVTTAGVASIAAAVSGPLVASAQTSAAENPELEPIRALLDAHDAAFANHDLDGVMASFSEKATIMGSGPGEIWSGPEEIKAAHLHFFEGFEIGELNFEYEFSIGEVTSDMGWMMTSGNVNGNKDGKEFTFPVNISLTVTKDGGKWLIAALHFSTLTSETQEQE